jgi:o-succinylbenzoate synthase
MRSASCEAGVVRLTHVTFHRLALPLVTPFRTSYGVETTRRALLIHVVGPDVEGWGECVAEAEPLYTTEYGDGALHVIKNFLLPRLDASNVVAGELAARWAPIRGHRMAKGGMEAAILDAECRLRGQSLAARLGAVVDRVPSGVSIGIQSSEAELLDTVGRYVAEGYRRVKLKIEPGNDVAIVRTVREAFPDIALQVDANQAYTLDDAATLAQLDPFDLLHIEQPLDEDDLHGHAELARMIRTPICLDESIVSVRSCAEAIRLGAVHVVNIKPGRVGGLLEAVRIHDVCVEAGVPVWCGGMLETGIGRAANLALAALPGFTMPGDLSASRRYFHRDVTEPFELVDGHLRVPTGPGIGVDPLADALGEFTLATELVTLR